MGPHPVGGEEDERVVAHPAPVSAGVGDGRIEAEPLADPARRVVDGAVLVPSQVEHLTSRRVWEPVQHRRHAVVDVEVALPLRAVTEDLEAGRVRPELGDEVDHVAVGVARAEDRHEAEDAGVDVACLRVGGDEALGGDLGGGVEGGLDGERRVLGRRDGRRLPVHGAGRGEEDAPHPVTSHRLQDVLGDHHVLFEVEGGVVPAEADVGVGGQVDHGVCALDDRVDPLRRPQVTLRELETRM